MGHLVELSARGSAVPRAERLHVTTMSRHPALETCASVRELSLIHRGGVMPRLPPNLRVLRLVSGDRASVQAIAIRLAPQLDLLDLRGSPAIDDFEHDAGALPGRAGLCMPANGHCAAAAFDPVDNRVVAKLVEDHREADGFIRAEHDIDPRQLHAHVN